jgi:hypothetical protein
VRNEEVLHRVKEERIIVPTVKGRKDNWIGHILRMKKKCREDDEEEVSSY